MTASSTPPGQRPSIADVMAREEERRASDRGSAAPQGRPNANMPLRPGQNAAPSGDEDEREAAKNKDKEKPAPRQPESNIPIQRRISSFPSDSYETEGLKVEGWFEWADRKGAELFHEVWEGVGESWNGQGRAGAMAEQQAKHHGHHHHESNGPEGGSPGPTPPGAPRGRAGGRNA